MRKLAFCLCASLAILGCSHQTTGVVGTWKSPKLLIIFKADKTWSIIGMSNDSGTWEQDGNRVKVLPIKIQGKTRKQYTSTTKGNMAKELENIQALDKAFAPITLDLDDSETKMKDKSGTIGDLVRQAN